MAAKKKTKKKQLKKAAAKNLRPVKKTVGKKLAKKNASPRKKSARKRPALKKAVVRTKGSTKKKAGAKTASGSRRVPMRNKKLDAEAFSLQELRARSAGQAGDLQGLSNVEGADSESVDELLEEGNAFEADVVEGVQRAGDAEGKEVRTHEVPEDDVPGEYLDKE
jgi:hypothetical protein